jgi:hypothetical protein
VKSAQALNAEGHRNSRGGLWSPAGIGQVLRDRRLIGERQWCELQDQPDGRRKRVPTRVQAGFFPPAISQQEFERCQLLMRERDGYHSRQPTRSDVRHNLFQGVARCPCGQLYSLMSQAKPSGLVHRYLVCKGKGKGNCQIRNHRYDVPLLLALFMAQRWQQFVHQPSDSHARQAAELQLLALEQQLGQQQQAAATAQSNLATLLTSGQLDAATATLLGQTVQDAQAAAAVTSDRLDAARLQLQQLMARPDGDAMAQQIASRVEAFMASDRLDPAVRRSFNSWLCTLGLAVELHHHQQGQEPLMVVRHVDGRDELELHSVTSNGEAMVHVKARPQAMADLWERFGTVETLPDGSQRLVIDGSAGIT